MSKKGKDFNISHTGTGDIYTSNTITGDLSTSASHRFEAACELVAKECTENLSRLWAWLHHLPTEAPQTLHSIEKRRANESAPAYENRVRQHYLQWVDYLRQQYQLNAIIEHQYLAFKVGLGHNARVASSFGNVYQSFHDIQDYWQIFNHGVKEFQTMNLSDAAMYQQMKSLFDNWLFKFTDHFYQACLQFCYTLDAWQPNEDKWVWFGFYYINALPPDELANAVFLRHWQANHQAFTTWLSQQVEAFEHAETRTLKEVIDDPYLLLLRKTIGLPSVRSTAEYEITRRKQILEDVDDVHELLRLAGLSYMESDGEAANFYLEKISKHELLPARERSFVTASLLRLQQPDMFGDSIGMMVLNVTPGMNGNQAGVNVGDILFRLDDATLLDPNEIVLRLGALSKDTLAVHYYRPATLSRHVAVFQPGLPAGLLLTPLIVWTPHQL